MHNYYQFMVPRLNGEQIKKGFARYRSLVRKGIAGFIIFGGQLDTVREYVRRLQAETELPLIISSDLERGLGQQLSGGTLFPPAMALAAAYKKAAAVSSQRSALNLLRRSFRIVAEEAAYAGINAVYAPVLDINTNPKNPIISVRAFGEEAETVCLLGTEMIKTLQKHGIAACGKHFPGHGDTAIDSHIKLPLLRQDIERLKEYELRPFASAIEAKVKMIMLGHLSVPALDASGTPVSFSAGAVSFIRKDMGYNGILVTDALNMGGIGRYSEEEAAAMALEAGVDILLHPSDIERTALFLKKKNVAADNARITEFRRGLSPASASGISSEQNTKLSAKLTAASISLPCELKRAGKPLLVILNDEKDDKGTFLAEGLKRYFPDMRVFIMRPEDKAVRIRRADNELLIIAIFSDTRAWKGGASGWLLKKINYFKDRADLFISFGSPYLLEGLKAPCMYAYWDARQAQDALAEKLGGLLK